MPSLRALYGAFVLVGITNAAVRPAARTLSDEGIWHALSNGLGMNPVVWMALGIGLWRLRTDGGCAARRRDLGLVGIGLLGLAIPIATMSWVVLGSCCFLAAWANRTRGPAIGLTILGLATLRDPLARGLLDVMAEPLLAADAFLTAALPELLGRETERAGNIVTVSGEHALLILSGCSSMTNVSFGLLAWSAIVLGFSKPGWRLLGLGVIGLSTSIVALNMLRLGVMSLSKNVYVTVHDGWGADLFLGLTSLTVLAFTAWGLRHVSRAF